MLGSEGETHEETHESNTRQQTLHGFARLVEVIVLDGGGDEFVLGVGVLS